MHAAAHQARHPERNWHQRAGNAHFTTHLRDRTTPYPAGAAEPRPTSAPTEVLRRRLKNLEKGGSCARAGRPLLAGCPPHWKACRTRWYTPSMPPALPPAQPAAPPPLPPPRLPALEPPPADKAPAETRRGDTLRMNTRCSLTATPPSGTVTRLGCGCSTAPCRSMGDGCAGAMPLLSTAGGVAACAEPGQCAPGSKSPPSSAAVGCAGA